MAISDNYVPISISGNGVTTAFSSTWPVLSSDALVVQLQNKITLAKTTQVLGVDFTLVTSDTGFVATFTSAPQSTVNVLMTRATPKNQTNGYTTSKGFQGITLEESFDKLTAITQEIEYQAALAIEVPSGTPPVLTGAPSTGCAIIWNADGSLGTSVNQVDAVITTATVIAAAAAASAASAATNAAQTTSDAATTAALAAAWFGTSATSNTIGAGSKSWTTQSGKNFNLRLCLVVSSSTPTAYFFGMASYTGTTLTIASPVTAGSGTFTDWVISVAGAQGSVGAKGDPGPAGSGAGDMLKANNLSDLVSASTARANLGLGALALLASINNANWSGTALSIANGGTGQTTAAAAFAALVQAATTGTRGGVLLASDAEAIAGTDTAKAVVPHALAAAISAALASFGAPTVTIGTDANGATGKIVMGSLKIIWGLTPANNAQGGVVQSFWEAFSGTPYNIQLTSNGGNAAPTYGAETNLSTWSASQFTVYQSFAAKVGYLAFGPV